MKGEYPLQYWHLTRHLYQIILVFLLYLMIIHKTFLIICNISIYHSQHDDFTSQSVQLKQLNLNSPLFLFIQCSMINYRSFYYTIDFLRLLCIVMILFSKFLFHPETFIVSFLLLIISSISYFLYLRVFLMLISFYLILILFFWFLTHLFLVIFF